jgi:GDP-L-fucose synthase
MRLNQKIYVAGHNGMVGSAILRQLQTKFFTNIVLRTHAELDLSDQKAVRAFMQTEKPDCVILAAAKVGGIHANDSYPANFIYQNLMIETNVIHEAFSANCQNLLFLGTSCIYPKYAEQPMNENALLTGMLEPTNEPYAIAKIAGIKLCESYNRQYQTNYRSVMPTNLYGPNDNFTRNNSHVIPAMMLRFHEAKMNNDKQVVVWGTGNPMREFLHVDDMAAASIYVLQLDNATYRSDTEPMLSHINVGTGLDCSIRELAEIMKKVVGIDSELKFDVTKPDGMPRRLLDVSRLKDLGWEASIPLEQGLENTYQHFLENIAQGKLRQ